MKTKRAPEMTGSKQFFTAKPAVELFASSASTNINTAQLHSCAAALLL